MSVKHEGPESSSTPIKIPDQSSDSFYIKKEENQSVEELIDTIDKNLNQQQEPYELSSSVNTNSLSISFGDQSPIKPLNLKVQQQKLLAQEEQSEQPKVDNLLDEIEDELQENIMQDIPKVPSFDELEFNTRINRTSSLSRVSGSQPLSRSNSKLPHSSSWKSSGGYSTRDNSPSKKSVCFEESPPKIIKYDQLTPENSDDEKENEDVFNIDNNELNSPWNSKIKPSLHSLPPLPPKHQLVKVPVEDSPSPKKDTTLDSISDISDEQLTKDDLNKHDETFSIEKKLDFVLNNEEISNQILNDEYSKGSSSPVKPSIISKDEELLLFNIKHKDELEKDQYMRDASELFEPDMRNNDKNSSKLRLDPTLKRRNSNSSLRDEERELLTTNINQSLQPVFLKDLKNEPQLLESPFSDEESCEPNEEPKEEDVNQEVEEDSENSNITNNEELPTIKTHAKKVSLSESITSGISMISNFILQRNDSWVEQIKPSSSPELIAQPDDVEDVKNIEDVVDQVNQIDEVHQAAQSDHDDHVNDDFEDSNDNNSELNSIMNKTGDSVIEPINNDYDESRIEQEQGSSEQEIHFEQDITLPLPTEEDFGDDFNSGLFNNDESNDSIQKSPIIAQLQRQPPKVKLEPNTIEYKSILSQSSTSNTLSAKPFIEPFDDEPLIKPEPKQIVKQEVKVKPEVKVKQETNPLVEVKPPPKRFDSMLFKDITPDDENIKNEIESLKNLEVPTPTIDYISIWNDQPKPSSPQPQYSIFQRKITPPEKVLNILNKKILSLDEARLLGRKEDSEVDIKSEVSFESLTSKRNSFVFKHSTVPSFISPDDTKSLLDPINLKSEESEEKEEKIPEDNHDESIEDDISNILANESLELPEVSQLSDFGNEFTEWNTSISKEISTESPDNTSDDNEKEFSTPDQVQKIWHASEPNIQFDHERSVSIDTTKLKSLFEKDSDQAPQYVKNPQKKVIVTNEEFGIPIEFDVESIFKDDESEVEKPIGLGLKLNSPIKVVQPIKKKTNPFINPNGLVTVQSETINPVFLSPAKSVIKSPVRPVVKSAENSPVKPAIKVMANSPTKPIVKLVNVSPVKTARPNSDELKPAELKPVETKPAEITQPVVEASPVKSNYGDRVPAARLRKPLAEVPTSEMNTFKGDEINLKKRDQNVNLGKSETMRSISNTRGVGQEHDQEEEEEVQLPNDDFGRLYLHINSINGLLLDDIKQHKAEFRIVVDNGKHVIATPKFKLTERFIEIDKEFEIALFDNKNAEIYISMKVNYTRPINELTEIVEKIPIKSNWLFGKTKYKLSKKFVTKKKEYDSWDNKFSNDGTFGKLKLQVDLEEIKGNCKEVELDLINEWEHQRPTKNSYQPNNNDQLIKLSPHAIGKISVKTLYLPRSSNYEKLPPSISIAYEILKKLKEQELICNEGYLSQEGGDCSLWKRRFFKLKGTELVAYHEMSLKPRAKFNLLKVVKITHEFKKNERNFTDEILMSNCFKLVFKNGEIINFNADTKDEKLKWINVLEKVVDMNKYHQPWVSLLKEKDNE